MVDHVKIHPLVNLKENSIFASFAEYKKRTVRNEMIQTHDKRHGRVTWYHKPTF